MKRQTRVSHPTYSLLPTEVEGFDSLAELALDMRWSWNHCADKVWRLLDPALWELTRNPWVVLQTVSRDQLERVLADPAFRKNVDDLLRAKHRAAEAPAWFQQQHPQAPLSCVAYFSMEFMLSEALPIYSGGLGNVAGDQLKAASDLGVPVVGVGLLYQQGYFRQVIDKDGAQQALIEQYLGGYAEKKLGITLQDLLALGRQNPKDGSESFNMAYLAIRGSGAVNGVSRLHGKVSRRLFAPLFPHWPADEVPVGHVTNGVHMPSWDSAAADELWTEACGKDRWLGGTETLGKDIRRVSDAKLWQFRTAASKSLIDFARQRLARHYAAAGALPEAVEEARHLFDPNALTLGFARRFATYKRPDLLLHDPGRLLRLLTNPQRPVQLFIAGKAHPADAAGQALIQKWIRFIRQPAVRPHAIFLSDYDMHLTERLVQGVDVWLNTPRRPWEACGTSGMKVLVNGGINLSELDGWWAEAYTPEVGWVLGDGQEHDADPAWDEAEAVALYERLEREVVPEFYARDGQGIPTAWVARMRESMARLTPHFSANRTVREYTEQHYLPAAAAYHSRMANKGVIGGQMVEWQHGLEQKWANLRFGEVKVETKGEQHVFEVQVYFDDLDPKAVRVELSADGANGDNPVRQEMERVRQLTGSPGGYVYSAAAPAARPPADYTARVIPRCDGLAIPLENARILWQR